MEQSMELTFIYSGPILSSTSSILFLFSCPPAQQSTSSDQVCNTHATYGTGIIAPSCWLPKDMHDGRPTAVAAQ